MLIAIMSNTFQEVYEKRHQSEIEERINLLNDFKVFLERKELGLGSKYLFVIKPTKKNQLDDSLESKIASFRESSENESKRLYEQQGLLYDMMV